VLKVLTAMGYGGAAQCRSVRRLVWAAVA